MLYEFFECSLKIFRIIYHFHLNIKWDMRLCLLFRDEVAACIEKSYNNITFKEATRMLFFQEDASMTEFSAKVG